jgi:hypothetical protein
VRQLKKGPDYEFYWEVWDDVLNYAFFVDKDDKKWQLYQNGDLFAYREDYSGALLCL